MAAVPVTMKARAMKADLADKEVLPPDPNLKVGSPVLISKSTRVFPCL